MRIVKTHVIWMGIFVYNNFKIRIRDGMLMIIGKLKYNNFLH
jgi:hypothetical protein